jgi:hypothetical protein
MAGYEMLRNDWRAASMTEYQRRTLFDTAEKELENWIDGATGWTDADYRRNRRTIARKVRQQVKTFGLETILFWFIGWLITRLLNWLWEKWKTNKAAGLYL